MLDIRVCEIPIERVVYTTYLFSSFTHGMYVKSEFEENKLLSDIDDALIMIKYSNAIKRSLLFAENDFLALDDIRLL